MHIGRSYGLAEFVVWTRRRLYLLAACATAVTALYQLGGWHWIAIPWPVLALLGTAASFIVGFKNSQTYARTLEAQQIWSSISAASRYWGLVSRDFPTETAAAPDLIRRHLAWLTAVRYQLRAPQIWEAATSMQNAEYRSRTFQVPEQALPLQAALARWMAPDTAAALARQDDVAVQLAAQQSQATRALFARQCLQLLHYADMQKTLKELGELHARAERLKNYPYPRQYAIVNALFVWLFALLLPFGMVKEFAQMHGAWFAIPFSVLVGWMYLALDQVGESTENPFEGSANDVPITHMSQRIECELCMLLGESAPAQQATRSGDIVL